jgi:fumarate reductase subunit C
MKTKEYVRPMPATWWLHNRHVLLFMVRELTSFFVAGYALFLLVVLYRAGQGREEFHRFFVDTLKNPVVVALQVLALLMVCFHSVTTFNAAPQIMVVWRGDERVDPRLISGANYALWGIASVLVVALALWYGSGVQG